MPKAYDKQVSDFLVATKGKAVVLIVFDGAEGNLFEVRATEERHMRRIPGALIEVASRIEGDFAVADRERQKLKMAQDAVPKPKAKQEKKSARKNSR